MLLILSVSQSRSSTAGIGLLGIPISLLVGAYVGFGFGLVTRLIYDKFLVSKGLEKPLKLRDKKLSKLLDFNFSLFSFTLIVTTFIFVFTTLVLFQIETEKSKINLRKHYNNSFVAHNNFLLGMLAENENTPSDILEELSTHEYFPIRLSITYNKNIDCNLLRQMEERDKSRTIKEKASRLIEKHC